MATSTLPPIRYTSSGISTLPVPLPLRSNSSPTRQTDIYPYRRALRSFLRTGLKTSCQSKAQNPDNTLTTRRRCRIARWGCRNAITNMETQSNEAEKHKALTETSVLDKIDVRKRSCKRSGPACVGAFPPSSRHECSPPMRKMYRKLCRFREITGQILQWEVRMFSMCIKLIRGWHAAVKY